MVILLFGRTEIEHPLTARYRHASGTRIHRPYLHSPGFYFFVYRVCTEHARDERKIDIYSFQNPFSPPADNGQTRS